MKNISNKLIVSFIDYLYLNLGVGFIWGNDFGQFITWLKVYNLPLKFAEIDDSRILGAEAALWTEVSNEDTLDTYLWIRASALAERLWNPSIKQTEVELVQRLVSQKERMQSRGIKVAPVSSSLCESNPGLCFKNQLLS